MLQKISTDKAPAAIGPYSQGIICNGMLFASGQIPINPANGQIEGDDITAQTELVCKNIGALLAEAGSDYTKVIKTSCFLRIWETLRRLTRYMRSILPRSPRGAVSQ